MRETDPIKWNQDIISLFSDKYFGSFLTMSNLQEEIVIEDRPLWLLFKNKKRYLLQHDMEKFLPIIPVKFDKTFHKSKLYHYISEFKSARFKAEKHYEFRDFVDEFMNVKHSNPKDFLLYKLILITSYLERINWRVATEPSFGKGGPVNLLEHLRKDVSLINPRSMAAVEYRLPNKLIVLDEVSNLESAQRKLLQEFLLLVGDFKNQYEKSTRGSAGYGTLDSYSIPHLSLGVTYNTIECYEEQSQGDHYFDKVFQKAVMDRFIPFRLAGVLDVKQFSLMKNKEALAEELKQKYIDFIRTIEYYKVNYLKEMEDRKLVKDGKFRWAMPATSNLLTGRQQMSFEKIARFVALYSKDEAEFQSLCAELLNRVRSYYIMLNKGTTTLSSLTSTYLGDGEPSTTGIYSYTPKKEEPVVEQIETGNLADEITESVFGDSKEPTLLDDIDALFESSEKKTKAGYPVDEFIKIFGEETMNDLIKKQELMENKPGFLIRLK